MYKRVKQHQSEIVELEGGQLGVRTSEVCCINIHRHCPSTAASSERGQKERIMEEHVELFNAILLVTSWHRTMRRLLYYLICFTRKSKSRARMPMKTDAVSVRMQLATEESQILLLVVWQNAHRLALLSGRHDGGGTSMVGQSTSRRFSGKVNFK